MKKQMSMLLTAAMLTTTVFGPSAASAEFLFEDGTVEEAVSAEEDISQTIVEDSGETYAETEDFPGAFTDDSVTVEEIPETVYEEPSEGDLAEADVGTIVVEDASASSNDASGNVAVNAVNFPDSAFRSYVSKKIDLNGDGTLSSQEIAAVTELDVSESGISSLQGIEYFTNLVSLDCFSNSLTSLDVSQNSALKSLYCTYNNITSLNVSGNTELTILGCGNNYLTELDVSNNPNLQELYCWSNDLTSLDVSKNTKLTILWCHYNKITALNLGQNTALQELLCYSNSLTSLDITACTALKTLDCRWNSLTTLDISKNSKLTSCKYDSTVEVDTGIITAPVLSSISNDSEGVVLSWKASAGAECYRVFRKTSGGSRKKIADTTATSYTDTTAASGTTYTYTVRCITADGASYTSSYDKTGLSIKYICAPVLSKAANASTGVKVTWKASTGAEKYGVYRKVPGGSWKKIGTTSSTSYTDKTAVSGTTYVYTVRCFNSAGTATTSGFDSTGLTISYIAAPTLSAISNTASGVKITWEAPAGGVNYRVYRKTSGGSWKKLGDTSSTSYTDTTGESGTTYYYTVRCLNSKGTSFTSSYNSAGLNIMYLSCGTISKLTNTSTGIKVTWDKVTGASGYYLYRKTSSGTYKKIKTITSASTVSYTDTVVSSNNGTTYLYAVKAYSGSTTSSYKSKTTVRLTTPTLSSVSNSSSKKMTVKWAAVSGVTGYQIMYSTSSDFSAYTAVKVSGETSVSKTISGLTKGETYYVRIRTYKTVSGTTYASGWTSKKSVTISK